MIERDNCAIAPSNAPVVDFAQFGPIERIPLSTIQRLTGNYLTRNWNSIPHVFHFDDVDITECEKERKRMAASSGAPAPSTLAVVIKALSIVLTEQPRFNSSLDANGKDLILKRYVNVGFAVNTPRGILVPVIGKCDTLSARGITTTVSRLSALAREKGLPIEAMSGGTFTVSSLGRNGGTGFSPIINAPEVAILGLSAMRDQLIRNVHEENEWRKVIPTSLSYDHRVINGVDAGTFMERVKKLLAQPARLISDSSGEDSAGGSDSTQ